MKLKLFLLLLTCLSVTLCMLTDESQYDEIAPLPSGLFVWKVVTTANEFVAESIPNLFELRFETRETYIVLETKYVDGVPKQFIYIWLGVYSTENMHEFAGIYAEQLNGVLGNNVKMIYRVVENFEPPSFIALFPSVFRSGVETEVKLFRIRAQKFAYFEELPPKIESFNSQDTFLLVSRNNLFVHPGILDNEAVKEMYEKLNPRVPIIESGTTVVKQMKIPIVDTLDERGKNIKPFLKTLGASTESLKSIAVKSPIERCALKEPSSSRPEVDVSKHKRRSDAEELVEHGRKIVKLWEFSISNNGQMLRREIQFWPLYTKLLNVQFSYVLATSSNNGLFIWLGNEAHKAVREYVLANASSLMADNVTSFTAQVRIVKQNQKYLSFDVLFGNFKVEDFFEGRKNYLQPDVA